MFYTLDIRKCPSRVSLGWQSALTRWSAYQCTIPLVETRPARVYRNPIWRLQGKALGWNSRYLDAKLALLQFSSSPVKRKTTKNTGEGTVNRATKTGNLLCNITAKRVEKRCCEFYHPRSNQSCNQLGCCRLRKVVAESREYFYRVWRDSRVILSKQKSVFTQLAATFSGCNTGLNVGGKTRNIAIQSTLS